MLDRPTPVSKEYLETEGTNPIIHYNVNKRQLCRVPLQIRKKTDIVQIQISFSRLFGYEKVSKRDSKSFVESSFQQDSWAYKLYNRSHIEAPRSSSIPAKELFQDIRFFFNYTSQSEYRERHIVSCTNKCLSVRNIITIGF